MGNSTSKTDAPRQQRDPKTELIRVCVSLGLAIGPTIFLRWYLGDLLKPMIGNGESAASTPAEERLRRILARRRHENSKALAAEEEDGETGSDGTSASSSDEHDFYGDAVCDLRLTQHECAVSQNVVDPSSIGTRFADIGGIDGIKTELYDSVVLPLVRPDLFESASGLVSAPRGVLLFGPPGSGKTMLAKAVAAEGGAAFFNMKLSSITNKWFGESNRLVDAIFSLAKKMQPSVIFVDEIDTVLSQRGDDGSEAMSHIKSEFLTLWDGLTTGKETVIVLGATNRPYDVDSAILRRMPKTFEVPLPDEKGREEILKIMLDKQNMTQKARTFLTDVSKNRCTGGYSGSDLRELCRVAAMEPVREIAAEESRRAVLSRKRAPRKTARRSAKGVRPVDVKDFLVALKKVKRTGEAAVRYAHAEAREADSLEEQARQNGDATEGGSSNGSPSSRGPQHHYMNGHFGKGTALPGQLDMQKLVQGLALMQNLMNATSTGMGVNGHSNGSHHHAPPNGERNQNGNETGANENPADLIDETADITDDVDSTGKNTDASNLS